MVDWWVTLIWRLVVGSLGIEEDRASATTMVFVDDSKGADILTRNHVSPIPPGILDCLLSTWGISVAHYANNIIGSKPPNLVFNEQKHMIGSSEF
jgi:hypothetical protein